MDNIIPPYGTPEELQAWNNMMETMVTFIRASTNLMNTITVNMNSGKTIPQETECEEACEVCRSARTKPKCGVCPSGRDDLSEARKGGSKVLFLIPSNTDETGDTPANVEIVAPEKDPMPEEPEPVEPEIVQQQFKEVHAELPAAVESQSNPEILDAEAEKLPSIENSGTEATPAQQPSMEASMPEPPPMEADEEAGTDGTEPPPLSPQRSREASGTQAMPVSPQGSGTMQPAQPPSRGPSGTAPIPASPQGSVTIQPAQPPSRGPSGTLPMQPSIMVPLQPAMPPPVRGASGTGKPTDVPSRAPSGTVPVRQPSAEQPGREPSGTIPMKPSGDTKSCVCATIRAKRLEEQENAQDERPPEQATVERVCGCGPTEGNTDAEMREMIEKLANAQQEIADLQQQMAKLQRLSSTKRFGSHGGPNPATLYKEIMRNNEGSYAASPLPPSRPYPPHLRQKLSQSTTATMNMNRTTYGERPGDALPPMKLHCRQGGPCPPTSASTGFAPPFTSTAIALPTAGQATATMSMNRTTYGERPGEALPPMQLHCRQGGPCPPTSANTGAWPPNSSEQYAGYSTYQGAAVPGMPGGQQSMSFGPQPTSFGGQQSMSFGQQSMSAGPQTMPYGPQSMPQESRRVIVECRRPQQLGTGEVFDESNQQYN